MKTDSDLHSSTPDTKHSDPLPNTLKARTSNPKEDTSNVKQHHPQNTKKNIRSKQEIDGYRVAKYRTLIEKGLYKVDSEKVAQKIIDAHDENGILIPKKK